MTMTDAERTKMLLDLGLNPDGDSLAHTTGLGADNRPVPDPAQAGACGTRPRTTQRPHTSDWREAGSVAGWRSHPDHQWTVDDQAETATWCWMRSSRNAVMIACARLDAPSFS